ncbi:MAG: flagellin FliC [Proteobacteria bacterium]|nr:flagellin FliC [Pseudomonadota bacterium]
MTLNIRTNIESLHSQRDLNAVGDKLRTSYARLSSGLRITRAADDAAGLAIAESLRSDAKIASVAIRNANDGISIIGITDGAVSQTTSILQRMAELAEQSANGVYSTSQRSALQSEFVALGSEIQRISETTTFNGISLLAGGTNVTLQVGFNAQSNAQITYTGITATLSALGLADANKVLSYALNADTPELAQAAARSALDAVNAAISSIGTSRGTLGAAESRLNIAIENLGILRENFTSAESRIRDVDVAAEAAELTRLQILQQAATAITAQANQQPQQALTLLQG